MNKINLYINILKWFMFFRKWIFKVWFLNLFLFCINNVLIWFICLEFIVMEVNCFVISICKSVCRLWYIKIFDVNIGDKFKDDGFSLCWYLKYIN